VVWKTFTSKPLSKVHILESILLKNLLPDLWSYSLWKRMAACSLANIKAETAAFAHNLWGNGAM
jgi:hypothetical protein